jgi:hypothetical protein
MIDSSSPHFAYTLALADWLVQPGAEGAFGRGWQRFRDWLLQSPGAESFVLFKSATDPRRFVSLGGWAEGGSTTPWPGFLERLGKGRALYGQSASHTFKLAEISSDGELAPTAGAVTRRLAVV